MDIKQKEVYINIYHIPTYLLNAFVKRKNVVTNKLVILSLNLLAIVSLATALNTKAFPDDFYFGVATAAYQVEGGWDADGKGQSIWDNKTHKNPSFALNNDNGDVACDTYHKWEEDIELLKDLGVNYYRFSLSWPRILPTGFAYTINEPGVRYYKNLIRALKANNIEPMVTLYHWDHPQPLQDLGGWLNPKLADYFADYARIAFREFGDDVKFWTTFNEPKWSCDDSYVTGWNTPDIKLSGFANYQCIYTVLISHAKVYHLYDEEFRAKQNGFISIALDTPWAEPVSNGTADIEAAERSMQFSFGILGNPIYNGNWPQVVIDRVAFRSKGENYTKSRLPEFTQEEIDYINGTYDFVGLNTYTTNLIRDATESDFDAPGYSQDIRTQELSDPAWNVSDTGRNIVPWGIRKILNWIKDTYNNPKILITENGVGDNGESLEDDIRIYYYSEYLSAVLDAIYEDEVQVLGYTAWSFLDNFEWIAGYSQYFGLYRVDFTNDDRPRTPKKSVEFYKRVVATHCLSEDECVK